MQNKRTEGEDRQQAGEVLETRIFSVRGRETRIMKVKVELDATKIVKSRLKIAGLDRKPIKISFKYERLRSYCNYCGDIDHEGRACPYFLKDTMGVHKGKTTNLVLG